MALSLENNQCGYGLEAGRVGLIATGLADALHDLPATELLSVIGCASRAVLARGLFAERTDACRDVGGGEAVGTYGQGNDRFGNPSHARLVEIDAADQDLADTGRGWRTLKRLIGDEARIDAAESIGKSLQHSLIR
jgi:hypothetical protein